MFVHSCTLFLKTKQRNAFIFTYNSNKNYTIIGHSWIKRKRIVSEKQRCCFYVYNPCHEDWPIDKSKAIVNLITQEEAYNERPGGQGRKIK